MSENQEDKAAEPKDFALQCHSNNAFPVLRIEGSITVRPHGKIVAMNSVGVETTLYENTSDREQMVVSDTGNIVVLAA